MSRTRWWCTYKTLNAMISDLRTEMSSVLKISVMPTLRRVGFKGTFPHFRRVVPQGVDLLTFQFDRNGGGFVIEIGRSDPTGYTTAWGKHIPTSKVTAWDLHPNQRYRIQPFLGSGAESWFRFDRGQTQMAASQVLEALKYAEAWWQGAVPSAVSIRI